MYARSTTMRAEADLQAGVAFVRDEVWPALKDMDGCRGFSLMVQPEEGRLVATASWQSMEAMRSSDSAVASFRERAQELMSADAPKVEEWEIAVMHRAHHTGDGTCVRAAWTQVPTDAIDRAVEWFKHGAVPRLDSVDGFCSASLMVDRSSGRGVSSVAFDDRGTLEASREAAAAMRAMATDEMGVEFLEVAEFDLALAHLHVPELV